jgi:predicted membrane-bound spermidine synthase
VHFLDLLQEWVPRVRLYLHAYVLRREAGLGLRAAGALVGLTNYYAAAQAVHRLSVRLPRDKQLQCFMREVLLCMKIKT